MPFVTNRKTVLFTLDNFVYGGVVSFVKQYSDVLRGHGFTIIILGKAGSLEKPEQFFRNCKVVVIPDSPKAFFVEGFYLHRVVGLFDYLSCLKNIFSEHKIDVIHLSTTWSAIYSLLYPKTWKVQKIITFYGSFYLELETMIRKKSSLNIIKKFFRKWLQFLTLKVSDEIITFSDYARLMILRHFSNKFEGKINIIPGFIADSDIGSLKKNFALGKSIRVLNFGRAEPRKGIDLLLRAIKILSLKKIKVKLILASPVEFYIYFDHLVNYENLNLLDKVHFIHKINDEEKRYLLNWCDVFVMPSKDYETFGMTILESLSRGVPVIGTPCGGIPEILEKVDPRLICYDITPESIADRILWFSRLSIHERERLSTKSITVMRKFYTKSVHEHSILSLYNKIT